MTIEKLFFELLQVAIGTRQSLSITPSAKQWEELFALSKKQALIGICFVGIKKLPTEQIPPVDIVSQFVYCAAQIQQENKRITTACVELVKHYSHDGMLCCILKGQGNLDKYPKDLQDYRTPGDIDIWCSPTVEFKRENSNNYDNKAFRKNKHEKRDVIEYVKKRHLLAQTTPKEGVRYHHIDAPAFCGIDVEIHFRPLFFDSPIRNLRLQHWFNENKQFGVHNTQIDNCIFPTPTISFNAIYQLCHIYRHLFDEGIGLRQLLDYLFVLQALHTAQSIDSRNSREDIMHILELFGMKNFARAVMYVLQEVFAMSNEYMICEPNEKEGKFLLCEIMMAGNFGKYDERIKKTSTQSGHAWEKLKHNFRLICHYPEEVLWEPIFRLYHWIWRKLYLWYFL